MSAIAGDRHVIRNSAGFHIVKAHNQLVGCTTNGKRIFLFAPWVWLFYLEALVKGLTEKTEAVEQTITSNGVVLGNSRIQEASGEAAQATIAQCCVIFDFQDVGELMAQLTGSSCSLINQT